MQEVFRLVIATCAIQLLTVIALIVLHLRPYPCSDITPELLNCLIEAREARNQAKIHMEELAGLVDEIRAALGRPVEGG